MSEQRKINSTQITNRLMDTVGAPRHAVGLENKRVEELMNEPPQIDPYDKMSLHKKLGHRVMERLRLSEELEPYTPEREWLADSQANHKELIDFELERARQLLANVTPTDRAAMDTFLGITTDESEEGVLPASLKGFFDQAREEFGEDISFVAWATEHATDEQLMNILQWHDHYLTELDESEAFKERIEKVKKDFSEGLDKAVEKGLLYPSVLESRGAIATVPVKHSSPLSPVIAQANGYINVPIKEVLIRKNVEEFTLYHEFTHLLGEGFINELNEGRTDIIAKTIYDEVHDIPHPAEALTYESQIATLDILKNLSGGKADTRKLSELSTGTDKVDNSIRLVDQVDSRLGYPLVEAVVLESRELSPDNRIFADLFIEKTLQALQELLGDEDGSLPSIDELNGRLAERIAGNESMNSIYFAFCRKAIQMAYQLLEVSNE